MIRRLKHYCNCKICDEFGIAYHVKTFTEIDTVMCKNCLTKFIDKIGKE